MLEKKWSLPMNLQFFADDPGNGGDDGNNPDTNPGGNDDGNDPGDQSDHQTDGKSYDESYVRKLRDENAKWRKKVRELEESINKSKNETISSILKALGLEPDPDKNFEAQIQEAQRKAQEAEQKANERLIRSEVKFQATELGIVDPDAAFALMAKDGIKVNDDGTVEGVKEALENLIKEKPYLKGQSTSPKGGGDFSGGNSGQVLTREMIEKMTPEEINKNWAAVEQFLRSQK